MSDLEKALDYVNNSILKEPDFIDSYLIRGQILIRKRDTEKAKADFLKVIDLDKENEIANWELGKIYFDSNEFDKAIDYFKNTLNINPRSFITLRELGFVYLQMKMYDKSIELLTKAKEQNPFDRSVVKLLTFAYEESKNLKECDRVINEYLKFFPNDFEMTSRLTYINYLEKEPLQAINVWKRYISTGVSDERAHFRLAVIYEQIGQFAFAEVELKKAIEINPKYYIAKNYLGYMYADRGTNLDESLKLITEALKGEPDNGSYLDSLGWIYFKKGDCVNAEKFLLKALELNPDESMINEHLGDVYYKMGKYEKAIEQWEKSLQTNPNNNEAQKKLMKIRI
ncbi:tetratricopeptide repeat protein [bacterium]|nr:tetratricopeptide repeat protein [bacterium]